MSARKDKYFGNRWYADFVFIYPDERKERFRRVSPVNTKRGAEAYERQLRAEIMNSIDPPDHIEPPTFMEFQQQFIDGYAIANNKASEVKSKEGIFRRYLLPAFGDMRLDEIGVMQIEKLKAQLQKDTKEKKGLSKKTVNNVLAVLSKMFNYAKTCGVLGTVPDIQMVPKVPKPDFDWLRPPEAERLLTAAKASTWYEMIYLAARTGMRYGELSELRWSDIDPDTHIVCVRRNFVQGVIETPKNGKPRDIPLSEKTWAMLQEHRKGQKRQKKNGLVFLSPNNTRRIRRRAEVGLKRTCRRAGLRPIGWHILRHTFASHLVLAGRQPAEIQELLGHSDITMTMRYMHVAKSRLKEAVEALDESVPLTKRSETDQEGAGRDKTDQDGQPKKK